MKEIKDINGFAGYFIDTDGIVWTNKNGKSKTPLSELKLLKLSKKKTGYVYANIYFGIGKHNRASLRVHRIVWETFRGPIPEVFVVDHINNIKDDNRLENLQLLTPSENLLKYWETEIAKQRLKNRK